METEMKLQESQALLAPWTDRVTRPEPNRLDVYLPVEKIVEAVQAMVDTQRWHLIGITGIDVTQPTDDDGQIEILYHFSQRHALVTLRIQVSYGSPFASSICGVIPSATLYERELMEMFGVILEGTPVKDKLLLPDDWPSSVYPMRKTFTSAE